jgi:hypothetical protein
MRAATLAPGALQGLKLNRAEAVDLRVLKLHAHSVGLTEPLQGPRNLDHSATNSRHHVIR